MTSLYVFLSVFLVSLLSFVGVLTLAVKEKLLKKILIFFVAFSAGALIGDAFIHLLPEATGDGGLTFAVTGALFAGIMCFFILEKILRWRHCHEVGCHDHPNHLGIMNLVGDGVHNFIDGILIAVSFLVSVPLGIATTLAVLLHEIPQELGDFGVLLHSGFSKKKAILFNFFSSSFAIAGAFFALVLGENITGFSELMIPLAAGGFIYIALSDLVPELHKEEDWKKDLGQFACILAGIFVMYLFLFLE